MTQRFSDVHARWHVGTEKGNTGLETTLLDTYRQVWAGSDHEDQIAVLHFIRQRQVIDGFDLVVEGMASEDETMASEALANALALLRDGYDLGPTAKDSLEQFAARHPAWEGLVRAGRRLLDER